MEIRLELSDDEVRFLNSLAVQHRNLHQRQCSVEDAVHECIKDAMFDEGEISAKEEF